MFIMKVCTQQFIAMLKKIFLTKDAIVSVGNLWRDVYVLINYNNTCSENFNISLSFNNSFLENIER